MRHIFLLADLMVRNEIQIKTEILTVANIKLSI